MNGDTTAIREALTRVDRDLAVSLGEGHGAVTEQTSLRESWAELVRVLALGPAPAMRDCWSCHKVVMRAATRCGFCWAALSPPSATA